MPDLPADAITAARDALILFIGDPDWLDIAAAAVAEAAAPALRAQGAAAERERIAGAGAVSKCCGAEYHREPGKYGRWHCHACDQECDLIGTIA